MNARRTGRLRRGLLHAASVGLTLVAAIGRPATALAQSDAGEIAPSATAYFPESRWLSDAHWLDDDTLLVSSRVDAINLWSVAVENWVEPAFGLVGVALLWMLLRLLRRSWGQWRLAPGQPHCRDCYYQLTGLTEPIRCPECGAELGESRIVRGHRAPYRALLAVLVLLAMLGGLYFGFSDALPRHGWLSRLIRWPSARSMNWAVAAGDSGFIDRHRIAMVRLDEIDARTGAVRHRIVSRPMFTRTGPEIEEPYFVILTKTRSILLMGQRELLEFDLQNGSLRRRIAAFDASEPAVVLRGLALDPQERFVCAIRSDRQSATIDLPSGRRRALVPLDRVPGWPNVPVAAVREPGTIVSVRGTSGEPNLPSLELFDLSDGKSLAPLRGAVSSECCLAGGSEHVIALYRGLARSTWSAEGTLVIAGVWSPGQGQVPPMPHPPVDLPRAADTALDGWTTATTPRQSDERMGLGSGGSPAYLTTGSFALIDAAAGRILATLGGSPGDEEPHVAFSPRGGTLAVWATGGYGKTGRRTMSCSVVFYDTSPLSLRPAAAGANQK
ncbi:MAG: hypothetical protein IT430_10910 [Phycisphaerales bacterium]|nr:hypothetical protein [Phycisphaerales bacterium]